MKKATSIKKEEKIQNLAKNSKPDVFYQKECFKKCMLFNKTEEECGKICNQICPNPINYSKDMAELAKFKNHSSKHKFQIIVNTYKHKWCFLFHFYL